MNKLSRTEREELEELRLYKIEQEGSMRVKAFARLENLINSNYDSLLSIRAFRVIADCLMALNEDLK
jgi:hypothetical protein